MISPFFILEEAKKQMDTVNRKINRKGKGILFHVWLYLYKGEENYRTSYYRTLGYTTTEFYLDQEFSDATSNTITKG